MNYIVIILTIAFLFGFSDFLTERYPRLQRDLYYIAFALISFLFAIKYYYGPDIWNYARFYDELGTPQSLIAHPDIIPFRFEFGFAFFCSLLKSWGLSFYWMTFVLNALYFLAIGLVFSKIERKRSFALAILVILDFNIIYIEYRQCLAVVAFLLMVLCVEKRKYLWTLVFAVLTVSFHKSGAMAVVPTLLYHFISTRYTQVTLYQFILAILVLMFLLPVTQVSVAFLQHLPLPDNYIGSIEHHLLLGRQVQIIFVLYVVVLICLAHYAQYCRTRTQIIASAAMIGLILVALFYQYYYLLNRVRSYFTPLVILFVFQFVQNAENKQASVPYGALIKQLTCAVIMVYLAHTIYATHRSTNAMKNKVCDTCTVFDLIDHRPVDVQNAQMKKAERWWAEDFMKNENNKINR